MLYKVYYGNERNVRDTGQHDYITENNANSLSVRIDALHNGMRVYLTENIGDFV